MLLECRECRETCDFFWANKDESGNTVVVCKKIGKKLIKIDDDYDEVIPLCPEAKGFNYCCICSRNFTKEIVCSKCKETVLFSALSREAEKKGFSFADDTKYAVLYQGQNPYRVDRITFAPVSQKEALRKFAEEDRKYWRNNYQFRIEEMSGDNLIAKVVELWLEDTDFVGSLADFVNIVSAFGA